MRKITVRNLTLLFPATVACMIGGEAVGQGAPELEYLRFTPVAIFGDGEDEMSVEARVSGSVESVRARDPFGRLQVDGEDLGIDGEFELDPVDSDVWRREGLTSTRDDDFGSLTIVVEDAAGDEFELENFSARFFIVEPEHRREVHSLGADVQATDHLLNINDPTGNLLDVGSSTETTSIDVQQVSNEFYQHMPDSFDFISIFAGVTMPGGFFHVNASNSVTGIGATVFDNTAAYGSSGRLWGVNFLGLSGGGPLLHETTHSVGVFLDSSLGLDDGTAHWGAVNIPGFLFGLDFEEQEDGDYLITWTRFGGLDIGESLDRRFPTMEQYLWGLAEAQEVPDILVLEGVDPNSVVAGDVVSPTSVDQVTMGDVVDEHGTRSPSYGSAPTTFQMAGVLVTPDRLASEAEMALWSRVMEHFGSEEGSSLESWGSFGSSFHFATDERGRMITQLNRLFADRYELDE